MPHLDSTKPIKQAFEDLKQAFLSALQATGGEEKDVESFVQDGKMEEIIAQLLAERRNDGTNALDR